MNWTLKDKIKAILNDHMYVCTEEMLDYILELLNSIRKSDRSNKPILLKQAYAEGVHDSILALLYHVFEIKDIEKAVNIFSEILNAYHDYPI